MSTIIAVEGIDGSGKSTFIKNLVKTLRRVKGVKREEILTVSITKLPEHRDKFKIIFEAGALDRALFDKTYADAINNLKINLGQYKYIIFDRHIWSSYAYSYATVGNEYVSYWRYLDELSSNTRLPDVWLYLNNDVGDSVKRAGARDNRDNITHYETADKLKLVRRGYNRSYNRFDNVIDINRYPLGSKEYKTQLTGIVNELP